MAPLTPETSNTANAPRSMETSKLIVRQPAKMAELNKLLETFENLNARVSERMGEDISGDMGGGGTGATGGTQGDDAVVSPREKAIRAMPTAPEILRQKLGTQIQKEVHSLSKEAKKFARSSQPGAAFHLNEIYAKIRRLNSLLADLVEASMEVLKRLFIKVFIDNQSIL
jgi:hypothetical protein